jgi:hypothetical protein
MCKVDEIKIVQLKLKKLGFKHLSECNKPINFLNIQFYQIIAHSGLLYNLLTKIVIDNHKVNMHFH